MFRGINAVNLDSKGRFAVPTSYRPQLLNDCKGELVVTIDTEVTCLLLYPLPEWEIIETKLQSLPSFDMRVRRIQRLLIGHATNVVCDDNGRILLPPLLREYAGLQKVVMLIGQGKKFEIWDEVQWQNGRDKWLDEEKQTSSVSLPDELKTVSL